MSSKRYGVRVVQNGTGATRYQPYIVSRSAQYEYAWTSNVTVLPSTEWSSISSHYGWKLYRFKWMALWKGKRTAKRIHKRNWSAVEEKIPEETPEEKREMWTGSRERLLLTEYERLEIIDVSIGNSGIEILARGKSPRKHLYSTGMTMTGDVQVVDKDKGKAFGELNARLDVLTSLDEYLEILYVIGPPYKALKENWLRVP